MKICYLAFCIAYVIAGKCYAQTAPQQSIPATTTVVTTNTVTGNISRPSEPLDIIEIDNYVTACFGMYDQTNTLQTQLNTIEQQVLVNKLSQVDVDNVETQLNGFNTQLVSLRGTGIGLLQTASQMNNNVYTDLKAKPLKIPGAYVRIRNSTKAVKVSLQNIHTMLTVTMVNIDHKLNIPVKADTSKSATAGVENMGKTAKTSISITGINFTVFNSFTTELATITTIKNCTKKFNLGGTSVISVVHYGDTDGLLAAILANCKDILTDKNIGGSEKGKITLAF
jgi:hypothetical protein